MVCQLPTLVQCVRAFAQHAKPGPIQRLAQRWIRGGDVALDAVPPLCWHFAGVSIGAEWWAPTVREWGEQLKYATLIEVSDEEAETDVVAGNGGMTMQHLQQRVATLERQKRKYCRIPFAASPPKDGSTQGLMYSEWRGDWATATASLPNMYSAGGGLQIL